MASFYDTILKPLFFRHDPEHVHETAVRALAWLAAVRPACAAMEAHHRFWSPAAPVEVAGLRFPSRVGLAAGFDKNAVFWRAGAALGFGHIEVGTITLHAQPGNDRPRLFRLPEDEALVNRMGFNNEGAAAVAARLARLPGPGRRPVVLGINLGKSRVTPLDEAAADYAGSFRLLAPHADYVAVNVSSPNTPGLRALQEQGRLAEILGAVARERAALAPAGTGRRLPLFVKIAPDLDFPQIDGVLAAMADAGFDGLIATNTTLARPATLRGPAARESGGLSGRPLRQRATEVVNYVARATGGRLPIIGVGGIDDVRSAAEKLEAGAALVQFYTGWIFRGPFLAARLATGLRWWADPAA